MGLMKSLFGGSDTQGAQIDPTQLKYLEDLWKRGQDASQGQGGQQFGQQFQDPSYNAFAQLAGGGQPINQQGLGQISQGGNIPQVGASGFQNQAWDTGAQNQALQGSIDAGLSDISRNFTQNILPGINTGSAMSNTQGGSRAGIASGLAAQGASRDASQFVNDMRSQNFNQMQNRGLQSNQYNNQNTLQGMGLDQNAQRSNQASYLQGQQNQLGAFDQYGRNAQTANNAMMGGLGQAPNLANLGFSNQYGNLSSLAALLGSPQVLGGAGGSQTRGLTQGFSDIFG